MRKKMAFAAIGLFVWHLFLARSFARAVHGKPAIAEIILDHASRSKTVMFGGRHDTYRADNDFVAQLLPKLREQGYAYLAVEFEKNPRSNSLHKVVQDYAVGLISRENMRYMWLFRESVYCAGTFDLIDRARSLDMKIIFYDADERSYRYWEEREQIAYHNLRELIFDRDLSARVVIFCGALHINERPHGNPYERSRKGPADKIRYLANYLNGDSMSQNFTVSLIGDRDSRIIAPHCDLVVDLEKSTSHLFSER